MASITHDSIEPTSSGLERDARQIHSDYETIWISQPFAGTSKTCVTAKQYVCCGATKHLISFMTPVL